MDVNIRQGCLDVCLDVNNRQDDAYMDRSLRYSIFKERRISLLI